MENLLLSTAVGDIAGSAYEGRSHRTKDYNKVKMHCRSDGIRLLQEDA